jgi:hypothetical protein
MIKKVLSATTDEEGPSVYASARRYLKLIVTKKPAGRSPLLSFISFAYNFSTSLARAFFFSLTQPVPKSLMKPVALKKIGYNTLDH